MCAVDTLRLPPRCFHKRSCVTGSDKALYLEPDGGGRGGGRHMCVLGMHQ